MRPTFARDDEKKKTVIAGEAREKFQLRLPGLRQEGAS